MTTSTWPGLFGQRLFDVEFAPNFWFYCLQHDKNVLDDYFRSLFAKQVCKVGVFAQENEMIHCLLHSEMSRR